MEYREIVLDVKRAGVALRRTPLRVAMRPRNVARLQRYADAWSARQGLVAGSIALRPNTSADAFARSPETLALAAWRVLPAHERVTRSLIDTLKADRLYVPVLV